MLFEPTYTLDPEGLEVEREEMFRQEQTFVLHEVAFPRVAVDTGHLGDSRLCRVSSTGHTVSLRESDCVSILVPRSGRMIVETDAGDFTAGPNDMLVFTPNMRVTHVVPDRQGYFEAHCALIELSQVAADNSGRAPEYCFVGKAPDKEAAGLHHLMGFLFEEGFRPSGTLESPRARDAAEILIDEAIRRFLDEAQGTAPLQKLPSFRDHHLVELAEELMRDRYHEALSTREIADIIGTSTRRLQVAFTNARGSSPLNALRTIRLDIARNRLLNPVEGETVTGIAMECGFFHLGRFSRAYAEAFGETPSQTRRRRRI